MTKEWKWQRRDRKRRRERKRMPVDGAGLKDVQRIQHKRWKENQKNGR